MPSAIHIDTSQHLTGDQRYAPVPLGPDIVIGNATGSLAKERVEIQLVSISCVDFDEHAVVDQPIKGFFVDADGKKGLSGKVVTRAGATLARSFIAERLALVGDAAHLIHPIAGQGFNQSMKDIAALSRLIAGAGQGEAWAVYTVVEGRSRARRVTLGHRTGQEAEVVDGLAAGEPVSPHRRSNFASQGLAVLNRTV